MFKILKRGAKKKKTIFEYVDTPFYDARTAIKII